MKRTKSAHRWMKRIWSRLILRWKRELAEPTILFSIGTLAVGILLVSAVYVAKPDWRDDYLPGVFIEFNGMLFDVFVFGIVAAWLIRRSERRQERQRQQEILDDYKKWDSEEGRLRIGGAVRRLNRLGTTSIDFGGIEISDFSFRRHDIKSIKGSTFYDGTWGEMGSRDEVKLQRVNFAGVDCREVVFSKFHPFPAIGGGIEFALIKDCDFESSNLSGATFKAHLEWTEEHPEELGEFHSFDDNEPPTYQQTHFPPFHNAILEGVSFVDATLKNADFRGAFDVLECDFTGARGLETCLFDDEKTKNTIVERSKRVTRNRFGEV